MKKYIFLTSSLIFSYLKKFNPQIVLSLYELSTLPQYITGIHSCDLVIQSHLSKNKFGRQRMILEKETPAQTRTYILYAQQTDYFKKLDQHHCINSLPIHYFQTTGYCEAIISHLQHNHGCKTHIKLTKMENTNLLNLLMIFNIFICI